MLKGESEKVMPEISTHVFPLKQAQPSPARLFSKVLKVSAERS